MKRILEERTKGQYSLECIDILSDLETFREKQIFATPTLEKTYPLPVRRVIADIRSEENALAAVCLLMEDDYD